MAGRQQGIDVGMVIDVDVIDMDVDLTKDMNLNTVASCCFPLVRQQGGASRSRRKPQDEPKTEKS